MPRFMRTKYNYFNILINGIIITFLLMYKDLLLVLNTSHTASQRVELSIFNWMNKSKAATHTDRATATTKTKYFWWNDNNRNILCIEMSVNKRRAFENLSVMRQCVQCTASKTNLMTFIQNTSLKTRNRVCQFSFIYRYWKQHNKQRRS